MIAKWQREGHDLFKATRRRVGRALRVLLDRFRRDLTEPAFLRSLPKTFPMPIAVLDEPDCTWVLLRVPVRIRTLLDEHELEIARGVIRDLPNKALGPLGTVKNILHTIFAKLGIHSRVQLALLVVELLPEDSNGPISN